MDMMIQFVWLINIMLYMSWLIGIWIVFFNGIDLRFKDLHHNNLSSGGYLYQHIKSLYIRLYGEQYAAKLKFMIALSFFIYIVFLIVFMQKINIIKSCILAAIPVLFIYLMIRVRVYARQINGSYEGMSYVSELLNQYHMNNHNMIEAITQCVSYLDDCPYVQMQSYRLSIKLKIYTKEQDIREIVNEFSDALNTKWAKMIGNCIFLAIVHGSDVTDGLEDILIELKRAKKLYEKSYQNTSEGFLIVKYILPMIYIGSIYMGVKYFGMSLSRYLRYQFTTLLGLKMFMINSILFGFNVLIMLMFKRRKFDIS